MTNIERAIPRYPGPKQPFKSVYNLTNITNQLLVPAQSGGQIVVLDTIDFSALTSISGADFAQLIGVGGAFGSTAVVLVDVTVSTATGTWFPWRGQMALGAGESLHATVNGSWSIAMYGFFTSDFTIVV